MPYRVSSAMAVSSIGHVAGAFAEAEHGGMNHLDAFGHSHDRVRDAHAEIHVEVRFQALVDALLHLAHQILHGMRREHAERIDQRQRVHVAFVGDAQ